MPTPQHLLTRVSAGWSLVSCAHARVAAAHWVHANCEAIEHYSAEPEWPKLREAMAKDYDALIASDDHLQQLAPDDQAGIRLLAALLSTPPVTPLAATPAVPVIPAGWMAPVTAFWEALMTKVSDDSISDPVLLDTLEIAIEKLPSLVDAMDVQALADLYEAAMGQVAVATAMNQAKTLTLAADDPMGVSLGGMVDAIAKLGSKTPVASKLSSADWSRMPLALRERGQFSAKVESIRFMSTVQEKLFKSVSVQRERVAHGEAYVNRDSFIRDMRRIAEEEGIQTTDAAGRGTVRDIHSVKRLGLIYDQQTAAAAEYTRWKMGQDPDMLDEFPAWRFVRMSDVETPRADHIVFEGQVRLKTDLDFWTRVNADFGVPWGPWGWGCGHDVEEVDRDEAEALGLIKPGETLAPVEKEFNDKLEASVKDWQPQEIANLKSAFGDQVEEKDGKIQWQGNLIADFFDRAQEDPLHRERLDLGVATPRAVNMADEHGLNLDGYTIDMMAEDVRQFWNRHGPTSGDRRPIDRMDIELVPHVWRDPDQVTRGDGDAVIFKKAVDERLVFVEVARSVKNMIASVKSVRREK